MVNVFDFPAVVSLVVDHLGFLQLLLSVDILILIDIIIIVIILFRILWHFPLGQCGLSL